jgi:hypothetical protein
MLSIVSDCANKEAILLLRILELKLCIILFVKDSFILKQTHGSTGIHICSR